MLETLHTLLDRPRPWRHLEAPHPEAERHIVRTSDELELHVRRLKPVSSRRRDTPVMLLHGLAANHRGLHLRERSLAEWLAEHGFEVWLPELRGHGDSFHGRWDWRIDDYLTHDIPALVDAILGRTGAERLHWVGHSMGGVLLMCYGIMHPDAPISRGVAVGSALDYKVGKTGFEQLLRLRPLLERLVGVPYGAAMHTLAPLMGRPGLSALEAFNVWSSNVEPEVVRALHARCFHGMPMSLLGSLATTFEPEGLRLETGFRFVPRAAKVSFPIRLMAGSRDEQVSVDAVHHTAEIIGENAEVVVHGPERGDVDHYGHWDLLIGRRAPVETWRPMAEWLER
jgi:pimeloyl-ACP methyl ester carboxylesterase